MCNDGKSFIPFKTKSYFSTVTEYAFYPVSGWMPAFDGVRAAMRLLSEQGDGLEISPAIRTATARYDVNGNEGLNDWTAVGTSTSTEGDSDPQDIDISTQVNNEFWVQLARIPHESSARAVEISERAASATSERLKAC